VSTTLEAPQIPSVEGDIDAAWRAEFRRRIDDIESGRVKMLTREESRAEIRAMLDEMRRQ